MDRRRFLELSLSTGAAVSTAHMFTPSMLLAESAQSPTGQGHLIEEWIAATPASNYRPYMSIPAPSADARTWVQIDLGSSQRIDAVRLEPTACIVIWTFLGLGKFPVRYKLSLADTPDFAREQVIADYTGSDVPDPETQVTEYPVGGAKGRYVRLTVTRMASIDKASWYSGQVPLPYKENYAFSVSRMVVLSGDKDISEKCLTAADPVYGNNDNLLQLTRPPRPMGEGNVTDNPANVIPRREFKAAVYQAQSPMNGVTLNGGLFQTAMEQNIQYLLNSFTVDELLRHFRERAGKPNPPDVTGPDKTWDKDLPGSNAGRFLMGAGNTLRWMEHPELRSRMNAVVAGIYECRRADGYIMAYPEDAIFVSEHAAYTRSWVTHGLIEAGYSGNPQAFELLRSFYDWFDNCKYMPQLLRRATMGPQGMIANTRMYFTPVGKPQDIEVIMRYFQENYWLEMLANQKDDALWQYPYDRPHCYEITYLEAYLDLYRATGDKRYLQAMIGAWQLFHDNWQNIGGSISMEEFRDDPPMSLRLDFNHGETCGTSFWTFFNQRLHLLYPEDERYMAEIEKSIYNVALANQDGIKGIRYFTHLLGAKSNGSAVNTCCEGQGTRMLGSLPEHIYSIAPDGFYVNLFEASTLRWEYPAGNLEARMETKFPFASEVEIHLTTAHPTPMRIRVRVPSWATGNMAISVNGNVLATGYPGTYVTLDRTWFDADTIAFTLPAQLKLERYRGAVVGEERRYSVEYGPILLAATGAKDITLQIESKSPEALLEQLTPKPGQPLHFIWNGSWVNTEKGNGNGNDQLEFMPYLSVEKQPLCSVPRIELTSPKKA